MEKTKKIYVNELIVSDKWILNNNEIKTLVNPKTILKSVEFDKIERRSIFCEAMFSSENAQTQFIRVGENIFLNGGYITAKVATKNLTEWFMASQNHFKKNKLFEYEYYKFFELISSIPENKSLFYRTSYPDYLFIKENMNSSFFPLTLTFLVELFSINEKIRTNIEINKFELELLTQDSPFNFDQNKIFLRDKFSSYDPRMYNFFWMLQKLEINQ